MSCLNATVWGRAGEIVQQQRGYLPSKYCLLRTQNPLWSSVLAVE